MTAPSDIPDTMWLPTVAVYSDGVWLADGRDLDSDDPQVLTDLLVRWGRSTVVDQPQPATCSLTIEDRSGGQHFLDLIHVGGHLDVQADALLDTGSGDDETVTVIDERFTAGAGNSFKLSGNANVTAGSGVLNVDCLDLNKVIIVIPPAPREPVNGNPAAWDSIPRALSGQVWHAAMDVRWPDPFAGYDGWDAVVRPCTFATPWADPVLLDPLPDGIDFGGWTGYAGDFIPPANLWVGVAVELHPTGPAWDDLDATTTWDGIPGDVTIRTNLVTNPGYEVGTASILSNSGANYPVTVDTTAPIAGTRSAMSTRAGTPNNTVASLYLAPTTSLTKFPVTPGQASTFGASVKTDVAGATIRTQWLYYNASGGSAGSSTQMIRVNSTVAGQVYRVVDTAVPPVNAATAWPQVAVITGSGNAVVGQRVWLDQAMVESGITDGSYFDGSTPDTTDTDYAWTGTANASTSTAATTIGVATWDSLGLFALDNVLLTAPDTALVRLGMVFSGRITDLEARYDLDTGATVIDVTAADQRAELGNRDVGDEPWPEERIGTRFQRIVDLSGQPIQTRVSSTAASYLVSWRDVDRQPAMRLLDELATSSDSVLWAATHPTTGPYLQLESMSDRVALFELDNASGQVKIVLRPLELTGAQEIDACELLLEPVRWRHDIEDVATRVAVIWREQTIDDEGKPKPTDHTELVTNPPLEKDMGVRRIAVATQLSQQADASEIADAILGRTGISQWRVSGLEWHVDQNGVPTEDELNILMKLLDGTSRNGLPIVLTNLPTWTPIAGVDQVPLFLEGGVYQSHNGAWQLKLVVSSATTVGDSVTWDELPPNPGWAWDDFDPAIRWIDLGGVAAP